jgi:phage tail sheath protein FI
MPEYLAPGVYVEEVSFRSKSIEGVSTTTTGFIGPSRYGPVDLEPDIITSLGQFERIYGDGQPLKFSDKGETSNFLWHAVRAFFEEGGKRLYISRVFEKNSSSDDGHASSWVNPTQTAPSGSERPNSIKVKARFPGVAGAMRVRLTLRLGQNVLGGEPGKPTVGALLDNDIVWISDLIGSPPSSPVAPENETGDFYIAQSYVDSATQEKTWKFTPAALSPPSAVKELKNLRPDANPQLSDKIRVVTLTVTTMPEGESDQLPLVWSDLALDPSHTRNGSPDSVFTKFAAKPTNKADSLRIPVVIERGANLTDGLKILDVLFKANTNLKANLQKPSSSDLDRSINLTLTGGNDGKRPTAGTYEGTDKESDPFKTGLKAFEDIEDISIIAAPGSTFGYENGYQKDAASIINLLISHAERMRYRIAVLDCGDNQTIAQVRAMRARIDSKYAAFYYPWVRILDPVTKNETYMPPSGFITGIYARNDTERAVYKAPANEVVRLSIGFEQLLNKGQQEVLNPEGINCMRFFEGRGFRVWGARTTSSDPEWKYVNLRRYFAYLERSIDRGTQWAVFEPNNEILWANVRLTIQDFLYNEWAMGGLLGEKPEKAYFVRCDRSTMTQNDLDNGRLVCLIGVAVSRPAEFVIFRIGQWTADRKQ